MRHSLVVAVGDRDVTFRRGVALALSASGFTVAGEAETAHQLLQLVGMAAPDVILVDARLLEPDPQLLSRLAQVAPTSVLAATPTAAGLERSYAFGARGYLDRTTTPDQLVRDLTTVAAGQFAVAQRLMLAITAAHQRGRRHSLAPTRRQRQVMALIEDGAQTTEIAALLGISPVTVRRHISDARRAARATTEVAR